MASKNEVAFLASDEDAAGFLSRHADPAAAKEDALRIASAFCALRSYDIRTSPAQGDAKPNERWSTDVSKAGDVWNVSVVVLYDKLIQACRQYTIAIDTTGNVTAVAGKPVGLPTGGYD